MRNPGGLERFLLLDFLVLGYTLWVALLVLFHRDDVPRAGTILAVHAFVLAAVALLPPRGAPWEQAPAGEPRWKRHVRGGLRFFRYSYPLLLVLLFFEEVQYTVNALRPELPHWFEPHLYAADRFLLGELPAVLLDPFVGLLLNELFHAFYLSYYFILIGGVVFAWLGDGRSHPGPAFQRTLTGVIAAFVLCFVWYPFLPARGPWENEGLVAGLTPFEGLFFTPLIETIIDEGAVSGGCFPSSHVGGSWAVVFGLLPLHRRAALVFGFFALGMSASCVYTRYHHFVDVPAGLLAGLLGAVLARTLSRREP
jgi:membrane-associated phospholipid phosphatase